jgi:hypothetical protein
MPFFFFLRTKANWLLERYWLVSFTNYVCDHTEICNILVIKATTISAYPHNIADESHQGCNTWFTNVVCSWNKIKILHWCAICVCMFNLHINTLAVLKVADLSSPFVFLCSLDSCVLILDIMWTLYNKYFKNCHTFQESVITVLKMPT